MEFGKPNYSQFFNWRRPTTIDTEVSGKAPLIADIGPVADPVQPCGAETVSKALEAISKDGPCKCTKALNPNQWIRLSALRTATWKCRCILVLVSPGPADSPTSSCEQWKWLFIAAWRIKPPSRHPQSRAGGFEGQTRVPSKVNVKRRKSQRPQGRPTTFANASSTPAPAEE